MNIFEKLLEIQNELKAPKNQYNSFGKYNYRSCEDILEALKPLCLKHKAVLFLKDNIININERYYVQAVATLVNVEKPDEIVEVTANARESVDKKGMDDSQITGATSSYARKYALNGLFNIDDTKDADTDNYKNQQDNAPKQEPPVITAGTLKQIEVLIHKFAELTDKTDEEVTKATMDKYQIADLTKITNQAGMDLIKVITGWVQQTKKEKQAVNS